MQITAPRRASGHQHSLREAANGQVWVSHFIGILYPKLAREFLPRQLRLESFVRHLSKVHGRDNPFSTDQIPFVRISFFAPFILFEMGSNQCRNCTNLTKLHFASTGEGISRAAAEGCEACVLLSAALETFTDVADIGEVQALVDCALYLFPFTKTSKKPICTIEIFVEDGKHPSSPLLVHFSVASLSTS